MGWVAAQLTESAACTKVAIIERDLQAHVPGVDLFFPAVTDDLPSPLHPLAAYTFVRAALTTPELLRVERSRYVEAVLRDGGRPSIISDVDLQRSLRVKLKTSAFVVGQRVVLLSGDWSGLDGRICGLRKTGLVSVFIELRSASAVVTVPYHDVQLL